MPFHIIDDGVLVLFEKKNRNTRKKHALKKHYACVIKNRENLQGDSICERHWNRLSILVGANKKKITNIQNTSNIFFLFINCTFFWLLLLLRFLFWIVNFTNRLQSKVKNFKFFLFWSCWNFFFHSPIKLMNELLK